MSQCFISSNQESLISSKLLTKQQEEKRKGRENVNRDYGYLLLLVRKEDSAWCVFFYSCVFIKFKYSTKSEWKMYCWCAVLLCIFIWYSPINVATIHSSSLLQFQWTASSDLSNHSLSLSLSHWQCANVSMWSNCNLSSGPDYPNHRSSSNFLKFLKVQNADLWLAPTVALWITN